MLSFLLRKRWYHLLRKKKEKGNFNTNEVVSSFTSRRGAARWRMLRRGVRGKGEVMARLLTMLKGLWRRLAQLAERARQAVPANSRLLIPGGCELVSVRDVLPPLLPEPFLSLLDVAALAREAYATLQAERRRPKVSRKPKALRRFLKADVSRTEELLLTVELSRNGACLVDTRERPCSNGQGKASPLFLLSLTERGADVSMFSYQAIIAKVRNERQGK